MAVLHESYNRKCFVIWKYFYIKNEYEAKKFYSLNK